MALLLTGAAMPGTAQALGVSGPLTHSALGQPLNLLFPLRLNADETLSRDCVRAEVLAGEARVPQGLLQFRLETDSEGRVRAMRLLSAMQIDEPIITVNLSLGCPVRFTRQFTAFVDPVDARPMLAAPPLSAEPPAAAEALAAAPAGPAASSPPLAAPAQEQRALPAPAAPVARVVAQAPAPQSAKPAPKPAPKPRPRQKPAPAPAPAPPPAPALAEAPPAAPAVSVPAVSRLRMDPLDSPVSPALAAAAAASVPASAPVVDETLARLQQLEDKLDLVRKETAAAEDQFKLLHVQLNEARSQRYQNVLVYGLGTFLAALSLICMYLWRTRQREREAHEKAWWSEVDRVRREREQQRLSSPMPLSRPGSLASPPQPAVPAPFVPPFAPAAQPQTAIEIRPPPLGAGLLDSMTDFEEQTMASAFVDGEQRGLWPARPSDQDGALHQDSDAPSTSPLPLMNEALSLQFVEASRSNGKAAAVNSVILDDENHEVSVEELIDLEQQVDFFEVLGQDDAAMDLLRQRIATGQASALPYLKLMEIHQRRGEEDAFVGLATQFTRRFKALPPTWGAKLNEGRSLEAYPRVLDFVQQHWKDSGASMALLQNLLSHGGEDAQGFDLPAYRDLLGLYGLARDHSEHEVRGETIDLFLPLDAGAPSAATSMMATQPVQPLADKVVLDLHLDIDLDQPAENRT